MSQTIARWAVTPYTGRRMERLIKRSTLACLLFTLFFSAPASGTVFLSVDEALKLAFPNCVIKRLTVFLTKDQMARVQELAGQQVQSALVNPYVATREGKTVGVAYFDTHRVRTQQEVILVAIDPDDRILRVETLAFSEPREYLPRSEWFQLFRGHKLGDDLRIKRTIRNVTGATITARVVTDTVRRTLALHLVLKARLMP